MFVKESVSPSPCRETPGRSLTRSNPVLYSRMRQKHAAYFNLLRLDEPTEANQRLSGVIHGSDSHAVPAAPRTALMEELAKVAALHSCDLEAYHECYTNDLDTVICVC